MKTAPLLSVCSSHLVELYQALEEKDIEKLKRVEHVLTTEEECVACAYVLKTNGLARHVLSSFLQKEGFEIEEETKPTLFEEVRFWIIRGAIIVVLFLFFLNIGVYFKTLLLASKQIVQLGSFGIVGVLLVSLATFIIIEQWVLE